MFAAINTSQPQNAGPIFLRWSDYPELPIREEPVEVIGLDTFQSVIRSNLRINEKTQVYLIGEAYTGNGIVRSCQQEGTGFLLTIAMNVEASLSELRPERDPGVLAVEDFLTEEEEAKILESLL